MYVKIVGGAGFVGNHLTKILAAAGHHVTVLDLKKPLVRKANVYVPGSGESSWTNHVKFEKVDITQYNKIDWAIDRGDFVVHLAAVAQFDQAERSPGMTTAINVAGTANILDACINNNASHIVCASTGSVYSTKVVSPITEDMELDPKSMYGLTKLWAEQVLLHYSDKIPVCILRFPHIIGSGKTWGANSMILRMMNGERPTIYGDGEQKSDFTHVDDITQAIELALNKQATGIYNIGSGESRSTLDFVKWAEIALDRAHVNPIFTPPRNVDFPDFKYDISKAKRDLGYSPKYNLEAGLKKTVDEWDQWL